jgi:gas vesicle protein
MRRFTNFLAGAFCGALVGAVTALLLAPYSGDELRTRAQDRMRTFRDEVQEAYSARVAQLESELASLRSRPEPEPTEE